MTQDLVYAPGPLNVRCSAHRKNGAPCKRWAVRGATVCMSHGGAAWQVRAAAARRIEASLDRAALAIVRLMEDADTPPAIKLAAARDLLDRGNVTGKQSVEVDVQAPWMGMLARMIVPMSAVEDDVIDAELVDHDPVILPTPPSHRRERRDRRDEPRGEQATFDDTPPRRLDPDNLAGRRTGRAKYTR